MIGQRPLAAISSLAVIAAASLAPSRPVAAQTPPTSAVNVFGTLDLFVSQARAGNRTWYRMEDGGHTASRLAFRGSEDLGGGLRANFLIEGGFTPDTGVGTLPGPGFGWTRQSMVGLSGAWGSVDAGRMYTPMFYTLFRADVFGVNAVFSPVNLVAATDAQPGLNAFAARGSNMVRYRTPASRAFIADLAYSLGESAGDSRRSGDIQGATIGWNTPRAYIGYGIQRTRAGSAAAPVPSPATSTYQALSGAYRFAAAQVTANYMRNASSLPGVPTAQVLNLGGSYAVTPSSNLLASIAHRKVRGSARAQLAATLGVDYHLSKRTALYGRVLALDNRGRSSVSLAQVPITAGSDEDVRVIALGLRHNF